MLIELNVNNFRSIRDEAKLSLVANTGKELRSTHVIEPDMSSGAKSLPILRSAALYGPNAGGKSNLIRALATMQRIVMTSQQPLEELPVTPFKLDADPATKDKPSSFEVTILAEGVRYQYGFSATATTVHDEWLYAFPKNRAQTWFVRTLDPASNKHDYHFGDKLLGDKDVWRRATRANALLLSTAIQLNSQQLRPIFDWFAQRLRIAGMRGWNPTPSARWCQDQRKDRIVGFLQAADLAIADVRVTEEDFRAETVPQELPTHLRKFLEDELKDKRRLQMHTAHRIANGRSVELALEEESDGTQKMFSLAAPWLDSLDGGNVLIVDELHDNLHPALVRFLINLFHSCKTNARGAQLIFSTHDTSILSQDMFRRDQIWFCERDPSQSTRLYPLTDFSPRKNVENLERAYLSGRYGAVPILQTASAALAR